MQLKADKRKLASKGYLRSLRREGKVPGVLHNQGKESMHLTVDSADLKKALHTSAGMNVLLNLDLAGETWLARIENIQYDALREGVYVHVDFGRVSLDQKIEVNVPVILTGSEDRDNDDGVVSQAIHEVTLLSAPDAIPDNLHADISQMHIGDSIHMRDLALPDGCEAITEADETLVSILPPRIVEDETTEETEDEFAVEEEEENIEPELVE